MRLQVEEHRPYHRSRPCPQLSRRWLWTGGTPIARWESIHGGADARRTTCHASTATAVAVLVALLTGMALGLALIAPIGPQNLFVLNAGLAVGIPRVFAASLAVTACDTLLITLGTLGAGRMLDAVPATRTLLLAAGVLFLLYLGAQGLRQTVQERDQPVPVGRRLLPQAAAVSLLNPHAILDTVGVIGAAAAAQTGASRPFFAAGAVTASLLWFGLLGASAAAVRSRLTLKSRVLIQRSSAVIMLGFALVLLAELWRALQAR